MRRSAFFLVALFLTASCYSYRFEGEILPVPPAAGKEEIPLFSYDRNAQVPVRFHGKTENYEDYTVREIKWAVKDFPEMKHKHAKAYFYEPTDRGKKYPGLIILPPTGGPYKLVKGFAKYFADRGFTVMALRRREAFFNSDRSQDYNVKLIRQAVIDARRAIDYLDNLDYVNHDQTCLMGISLGGIVGALTMETDPRVKAAGFLVTAGHLPDILATSGYSHVDRYRDALIRQGNIRRSQIKEYATPIMRPVDPVTYADRLDPGRIIMINGAMDDIIVREVVMKTHESYGRPQLHFIPGGHYTSIGFSSYANGKIYRHFRRVLGF